MKRTARAAASRLFAGKLILAPMVRAGTLPLRLTAIDYGCDTVFSEEIIDRKIARCSRVENKVLGTIDFVELDQSRQNFNVNAKKKKKKRKKEGKVRVTFRTLPSAEKSRLVFQMGSSNPEYAVQAALKVQHDVSGIDLNMGCPKKFSVQDGMGIALLSNGGKIAADILRAIRKNTRPELVISCKIRLLETQEDTIKLVRNLADAGAEAISVHSRLRTETENDRGDLRWAEVRWISDALSETHPWVIVNVNGDCFTPEDCAKARELSGASGVMIARAAMENCSIFAGALGNKMASQEDFMSHYVKRSLETGNNYQNTKYVLQQALRMRSARSRPALLQYPGLSPQERKQVLKQRATKGREIGTSCKSMKDIADMYGHDVEGAARMLLAERPSCAPSSYTHIDVVSTLLRLYDNYPPHEYSQKYLEAQDKELETVLENAERRDAKRQKRKENAE